MSASIDPKETDKRSSYMTALLLILLGVAVDQWSKQLALSSLKDQEPLVLIRDVFQLRYLENRGAAFGLLQNRQWFFVISGAVILAAVLYFYGKLPAIRKYLPLKACAVLLSAGAIGNMIDRIRLGYVIDFFYFNLIDFPIFNVADIYVTCSAFGLMILLLFCYREEDLEHLFHNSGRK